MRQYLVYQWFHCAVIEDVLNILLLKVRQANSTQFAIFVSRVASRFEIPVSPVAS